MEIYYLCQPNTYVITITAAHQIHEQWHTYWVDIGSIPPFLCPLFYLEQIFLPSLVGVGSGMIDGETEGGVKG